MKENIEIKDGKLYYTLTVPVDGERLYPRGASEPYEVNPNFTWYKTDRVRPMITEKGHLIGDCVETAYVANDSEENSTGTWVFISNEPIKKTVAKKPAAKKTTTTKKTTTQS